LALRVLLNIEEKSSMQTLGPRLRLKIILFNADVSIDAARAVVLCVGKPATRSGRANKK
jgi:hypothetical protein